MATWYHNVQNENEMTSNVMSSIVKLIVLRCEYCNVPIAIDSESTRRSSNVIYNTLEVQRGKSKHLSDLLSNQRAKSQIPMIATNVE
jgi:ribosome maturation protein Sdo1